MIVIENGQGRREIGFDELHRLPGDDPRRDTNLASDDLTVAIELPAFKGNSHYLKVRDRASYAYALLSCAVAIETNGDRIAMARIALGSVAHKPWRVRSAEAMLEGRSPSDELFRRDSGRGAGGCEDLRHERLQAGAWPCPRRTSPVGNGGSVTDAGAAGHRLGRQRGRASRA